MPQLTPENASQLVDVLHTAEDVEVREVSLQNRYRVFSAIDRFLRATDSSEGDERAFVVRIRPRKEPTAAPSPVEIPEDRGILLHNARTLLENEEFVLARNVYSYLLKGNLRDRDALMGLGQCFLGLGELSSARKCFDAVLDQFGDAAAQYWLGVSYLRESNDAQAMEHFRRIPDPTVLPEPLRFALLKDLGNCHTRAQRYEEALAAYQGALALQPGASAIEANLGTLELQRGQIEEAKSHFERALESDPRNGRAHCGLGILARSRQSNTEAEAHFEKALTVDPPNRIALFQLAEIAHQLGSYSKAREKIGQYLSQHPTDADAHFALALIQFRQSDLGAAEGTLNQVLEIQPNHARASKLKAELLSLKNKK